MDTAIRVGIADDHLIVRAALRQYFHDEGSVRVVAEASTGRGAIWGRPSDPRAI